MRTRLLWPLIVICGCSAGTIVQNADIGNNYVGAMYINDPLGEEKFPDTDPLIRTDAFDCTTFVETVLANGDVNKLNNIRYKNGNVDFLARNHFIESDWLTNNSGIVENKSCDYGPVAIRTVVLDKKTWFKRVHHTDTGFMPTKIELAYIPYKDVPLINNNTPLIVLFVADNPKTRVKIGTDIAVTHMGFLLPNGILRHASSADGAVVDVDFYDYIYKRAKNKNNLGISLVEVKWDKIR